MSKIKKIVSTTVFLFMVLTVALAAEGWTSQEVGKFPSKYITFIIPVRPGGGMDMYVRLVTPYLQKYLPNQPKIIIKNIPGADKAAGTNACLRAEPDGHTLVELLIPGQNLGQMLGLAKYDLNQAAWIGGLTRIPNIFTISAKRPERTLKELQQSSQEATLTGAITGLNSPAGAGSIIAAEVLGVKTKFIPHSGSAPAVLATIRGSSDYVVQGYPVLKSGIENKQLIPLCVYSDSRFQALPDVPTIVELGHPELVTPFDMYYSVATGCNVPKETLSILREAFKKAVEDPGFDKAMKKAGSYAFYTSPEGMEKALKNSNELYSKYMNIFQKHK